MWAIVVPTLVIVTVVASLISLFAVAIGPHRAIAKLGSGAPDAIVFGALTTGPLRATLRREADVLNVDVAQVNHRWIAVVASSTGMELHTVNGHEIVSIPVSIIRSVTAAHLRPSIDEFDAIRVMVSVGDRDFDLTLDLKRSWPFPIGVESDSTGSASRLAHQLHRIGYRSSPRADHPAP